MAGVCSATFFVGAPEPAYVPRHRELAIQPVQGEQKRRLRHAELPQAPAKLAQVALFPFAQQRRAHVRLDKRVSGQPTFDAGGHLQADPRSDVHEEHAAVEHTRATIDPGRAK